MKYLLTLLTTVTVVFGACNKSGDDNPSELFTKVYSTNNLESEKYLIESGSDTIIKGNSGTILRIYKNTFVDKNGQAVSGPVEIELKEALTPYDLIMGNLTTVSNGQWLQSGGMVYINATSNGQQLEIGKDKFIGAIILTDKVQSDMQVYEGIEDSTGFNWINPDNILNNEVLAMQEANKTDTLAKTGNGKQPSDIDAIFGFIRSDSSAAVGDPINDVKKDQKIMEGVFVEEFDKIKGQNYFNEDIQTTYIFSIKKLGWANIDRLFNDPRTKEIDLITSVSNHKDFKLIYVTMIVGNMYLPGYQKADETFGFTHGDYEKTELPIGEKATILVTAYKDGVPYFAFKKIVITDKQTVALKLSETTMDKLKATLQKI